MNTDGKNNLEETNGELNQKKNQGQFWDKLIAFLKNNKAATFLSLLLLIVIVWFTITLRTNESSFINEKAQLKNQYKIAIDSLQIKHQKFATEVFSWSVRSELLRNNAENLNQLLTAFVKESGADLVQIVNSEDKMVLLSSDKKFEGVKYTALSNFELKETTILEEDGVVKIITPVMGFNNMIGILIVETRKK
jgi:hypothetical protein